MGKTIMEKGWGLKVIAVIPADEVTGLPDYAVKVVYDGNEYCPEGLYEYKNKDELNTQNLKVGSYPHYYFAESYMDYLRTASHEEHLKSFLFGELMKRINEQRKASILELLSFDSYQLSEIEGYINGDILLTIEVLESLGKVAYNPSTDTYRLNEEIPK